MMNWKNGLVFGLVAAATSAAAACSSDSGSSNNAGTGGQVGSGGATGNGGSSSGGSGGAKTFDAGTDPNRNAVVAGGLCQRLAEIQCAGEAYCCNSPGRTVDACITAQKSACTNTLNFDSVAADSKTGFDAAAAKTAFTTLETKASTCSPDIAAFGASPTGLRGVAKGTVAAGGTCNPTSTSDLVAIAVALASCADPASDACLPATGDWKCTALADAGGACFSDVNCKEGLYCDNPGLSNITGSTCKARKADGEACTQPNECTGLACVSDKCASGQQAAYCLKQ